MSSIKIGGMVAYSCFVHIKQMKLISFRSELFLLFHIEKLDFMLSFESLLSIGTMHYIFKAKMRFLLKHTTLAISKFLCKENAGAVLKPLLISNE